uniref:Uncharacterized protein n=1 Tax=Panagrolaimus sp. JU765 TaxID=591449 RepID=A0AC34QUE7_9BILA
MSSRYTKKRKHDLDLDTSGGGGGSSRDHDEASPKKSSRRHKRESSGSPPRQGELKKIHCRLKKPTSCGYLWETESAEGNVIIEDGMEFVHKAAESLTKKKETDKIKSKIDVQAQKRKIQSKLLKAKGLADTDSEDEGVESWIEKNRQLEEEKKKALQKAKELDAFEDELDQNIPKKTVKKARSKLNPEDALAGMTVGHSKSAFMTGEETILVLDDKDVLDDNGEEVLVNPTLMYNEQLKRNKETRNKKSDYNPYDDEEIDEFGVYQ